MRLFRFTMVVVASCVVASQSFGQSGVFTRIAGDVSVSIFTGTSAYIFDDSSNDEAMGDILVNIAASQSTEDPFTPALGQVTTMAQAMNLTPVGAQTSLPTVDTTLSRSTIAITTDLSEFNDARALGNTSAVSNGAYQLDGTITSGYLHGSMYLLGVISELETGGGEYVGDGFVRATIGQYSVEATYSDDTELWEVDVDLPGFTESFFTGGLNNFFTFTVTIESLTTISLNAISTSNANSTAAVGQDSLAQGQVSLSASAWLSFTPTILPPPNGDFDGDGDVDGFDFLAFQRGFGEDMGATLSQGDANHDGIVNSADFSLWEGNFGTTSSALSSAVLAVPEPTTFSIAMAVIPAILFRRNKFRKTSTAFSSHR